MYRIYGKKNSDKKYKPFDMASGAFIKQLIHIPIYAESVKAELDKEVCFLNTHNPDYSFIVRQFNM